MVSGITQPSMAQSQMGGLEDGGGLVCLFFFLPMKEEMNEFFIAISVSLYFGWRLRQRKQSVTY